MKKAKKEAKVKEELKELKKEPKKLKPNGFSSTPFSNIPLLKVQTAFLSCLLILILASFFYPKSESYQTKLAVAYWPLSTKKHLKLSQMFFNNRYQESAEKELKKAEQLYSLFSFLDINKTTKEKIVTTKALIQEPKKIEKAIKYWEEILKSKPYFRDAYLNLSILNYRIREDEKANQAWKKAFYLDPNNILVEKTEVILNQD